MEKRVWEMLKRCLVWFEFDLRENRRDAHTLKRAYGHELVWIFLASFLLSKTVANSFFCFFMNLYV